MSITKIPEEVLLNTNTQPKSFRLLIALIFGVIAFQINCSMISPALPLIAHNLNISMEKVSNISSLFFLSGSIFGLLLSRISDYFGRKTVLLFALFLCCTGTIICTITDNYHVMLFARILQGASSSTFQLSYLILHRHLSPKKFGTALGFITAVNGGVGGVDVYFGGVLADHFGFRSIFLLSSFICLLALTLVSIFIPKDQKNTSPQVIDWLGAITISFCIISINLLVNSGNSNGWLHSTTLCYFALFSILSIVFYYLENKSAAPLVPLKYFCSRSFWPIIATTIFTLAGVFSFLGFAIVIISQNSGAGYGMTATESALVFLAPPALIGFIFGPITGWLATKVGWLTILRIGIFLCLILLCTIAVFSFTKTLTFVCLLILGMTYYGLVLTTISGISVLFSPKEVPSVITAVNGASYGIGASLGIGFIASFIGQGTFEGFQHGLWICALFTGIAFCASLILKKPIK